MGVGGFAARRGLSSTFLLPSLFTSLGSLALSGCCVQWLNKERSALAIVHQPRRGLEAAKAVCGWLWSKSASCDYALD